MKIQSIASYNNYYQNNTPRKINKQYRPFLQETQKRPIAFTGSGLNILIMKCQELLIMFN